MTSLFHIKTGYLHHFKDNISDYKIIKNIKKIRKLCIHIMV